MSEADAVGRRPAPVPGTGPVADGGRDGPAPVLVVGATGKTGRAVAAALVARGVPVRGAVRRGREGVAPAGSTPVVVDLLTGQGLVEALDGAAAAYHLAPNVHPDEVGMAARVAGAVTAAGVPRLVFHSVLHPDDRRMPHHLRKAEAEALLRRVLGDGLTVLRPAAYHQNLTGQVRSGVLRVPYSPDAPFTTVDLHDVAEVAAHALAGRHAGDTLDLAGPEVLTTRQMAEQAGHVLGRPVAVERQPLEEWIAGPGSRLTTSARDDLTSMFTAYDEDGLVGDVTALARLLARPPVTWADAVARSA